MPQGRISHTSSTPEGWGTQRDRSVNARRLFGELTITNGVMLASVCRPCPMSLSRPADLRMRSAIEAAPATRHRSYSWMNSRRWQPLRRRRDLSGRCLQQAGAGVRGQVGRACPSPGLREKGAGTRADRGGAGIVSIYRHRPYPSCCACTSPASGRRAALADMRLLSKLTAAPRAMRPGPRDPMTRAIG